MNIERFQVANNGLLEVHGEGPMCWYEDLEPILLAVKKIVECKGRFHTEQNFKALADEWEKIK